MYFYFVNKSDEIGEKYAQSKKRLYEKYVDSIFGTMSTLTKEIFTEQMLKPEFSGYFNTRFLRENVLSS